MSRVRVDFTDLIRWKDVIKARSGQVKFALRQWAIVYRAFVQERFARQGDGTWRPLKQSTIARRRKRVGNTRFSRVATILRDTGTLFAALNPVLSPGAKEELSEFGITVGFGGSERHPGGGITIKQLAEVHQSGLGRVPKREIIVKPDSQTISTMAAIMEKAVDSEYV